MVKKTVKLAPQERFDIIDALALQQGTLDYLASALGNIMGYSNGLLTELRFTDDSANNRLSLTNKFAFFVTKKSSEPSGSGYSGEVVVYDPTNPAQAAQTVDYSSAKNAATAYFASNAVDSSGKDASVDGDGDAVPISSGAHSPFLWARPIQVTGQLDARRKWSIAAQAEVPVTMDTRTITAVSFAFSATMPEYPDGEFGWAPIGKVVQWQQPADNPSPRIIPISAFDNQKWHDLRARNVGIVHNVNQRDMDPLTNGDQVDWFSGSTPNHSGFNTFGTLGSSIAPSGSILQSLLEDGVTQVAGDDLIARLSSISELIRLGDELEDIGSGVSLQRSTRTFIQGTQANRSNGIVDQINCLRIVLQNAVGQGYFDYGDPQNGVSPFARPFMDGSNEISNLITKLKGASKSHWSALPMRSLNSLSLENMLQNSELARLRSELDALKTNVNGDNGIEERVQVLEAEGDGFSGVPINDAQPLVPAAVVSYVPTYGDVGGMHFHVGPAGAIQHKRFFLEANIMSRLSYARGGVEIGLSDACLESLGGLAALTNGQCVIQATPIHYTKKGHWLVPHEAGVATGRVWGVGEDDRQNAIQTGNTGDAHFGEKLVKNSIGQQGMASIVERNYANFFQCTLNVVVDDRSYTYDFRQGLTEDQGTSGGCQAYIRVYPVCSVPSVVDNGADLRGYPAYHGWVNYLVDQQWYGAPEANQGQDVAPDQRDSTWQRHLNNDIQRHVGSVRGDHQGPAAMDGRLLGYLMGDVTNPDIFRRVSGDGVDLSVQRYNHLDHSGAPSDVAYNFTKDKVFGTKDDLRGYAHAMTFLRPDRFNFGGNTGFCNARYGAAHNAPHVHSPGESQPDEDNFGEMVNPPMGHQGRFMPGFSLVIYKNTFTGLGTAAPDMTTYVTLDSPADLIHIIPNSSLTPTNDDDQPTDPKKQTISDRGGV